MVLGTMGGGEWLVILLLFAFLLYILGKWITKPKIIEKVIEIERIIEKGSPPAATSGSGGSNNCGYCGATFVRKMSSCPHCGADLTGIN